LDSRKVKTEEQAINLLVSDRIKETLGPVCLRHAFSTEGTEWFGPEKLADVIGENSQMYMPAKYMTGKFGKYEKYSSESLSTGSAKSTDKFMKFTLTLR